MLQIASREHVGPHLPNIVPMTLEKYRHPVLFYFLATAIPWTFWIAAAHLSHITPTNQVLATAVGVLGVAGLLGPTVVAFWMIWPHVDLRSDLMRRIVGLKGVRPIYLFLTCFLMFGSILLAQAISLLFGYGAEQFTLSERSSFSAGIFPGWFLLFLAPLVEELAWHSCRSGRCRSGSCQPGRQLTCGRSRVGVRVDGAFSAVPTCRNTWPWRTPAAAALRTPTYARAASSNFSSMMEPPARGGGQQGRHVT